MPGELLTRREAGVLTITLNRPEVFNALTRTLQLELRDALDDAADPTVRARRRDGRRQGILRRPGPSRIRDDGGLGRPRRWRSSTTRTCAWFARFASR